MTANKFTQLVADLESGELGWLHLQNATREWLSNRDDLPVEIKDLVGSLITEHYDIMQQSVGKLELAVRRARINRQREKQS